MTILIQSIRQDMHAAAVVAALSEVGVPTVLSIGTDVPENQCHSYKIVSGVEELSISRHSRKYTLGNDIDLVWSRRVKTHHLQRIHPDDLEFVDLEFSLFIDGFCARIHDKAKWINPWQSRLLANTKIYQFNAAISSGFDVAPTLISNSPEEIRSFVSAFEEGDVVFKTISPGSWLLPDGGFAATPAVIFPKKMLRHTDSLQNCPGIYQQRIAKKNEYRVTVMGGAVHAVRIVLDQDKVSIDWRNHYDEIILERYHLPPHIDDACRNILSILGLRFGCIDMIEGLDGRWYFLEINEMGQFLWIEQIIPEMRYLESFVNFIIEETGDMTRFSGELSDITKTDTYRNFMMS